MYGSLLILILLLSACGTATEARNRSAGQSDTTPLVHFPEDQASHPHVANEWWYVVGHVRAGRRTFGYEVTIFKFNHVQPQGFSAPVSLFRTDVAITDEASGRFLHHITYYFPQSATLSATTLDERVGNAAIYGSSPRAMTLRASFKAASIKLNLSSQRGPMYVGGRGYLPFGNGFTYYYSLTDLATIGSLRVGSETFSVRGISWLDHQWGTWSWSDIRGWTWMAWQLGNGTQMSVFDFRGKTNHVKAASVLLRNGRLLTLRDVTIESVGSWRSPHSGAVYPSGWKVRIPALQVLMRVEPTVRDQEMVIPSQLPASYWEGSTRLQGRFMGKSVSGLGYTELTGYAGHGQHGSG